MGPREIDAEETLPPETAPKTIPAPPPSDLPRLVVELPDPLAGVVDWGEFAGQNTVRLGEKTFESDGDPAMAFALDAEELDDDGT